ncbi:homoserine kinase [Terriglobus saanensis]|uniref:Homoserine kinase n=1 Tax=Terriglobus saanensis (strain ATCC BAA-1853 / DSM 23119 / SP1PR4) TaxID=401053 RepID=E8UYC9_TERSS|nr:homoserine kinase [Terriglobus saanensis]ADV82017.1 homoserine kinase [Terriglobus saanensis SP1PR4]
MSGTVRLRLPATSANLGPGFDALGLAMDFHLYVEAAVSGKFAIEATGRNAQVCGDVEDSLILSTYQEVLGQQGISAPSLALKVRNEIPLGMGCGSSAAALVAGVALASHFGKLGWNRHEILTEASLREGHPDNVAACVMGGLTVSAMSTDGSLTTVSAVSLAPATQWPLLLVMPGASLSTSKARGLLPESYSRADTVANIQAASLLTAAFATGRGELLALAMRDRVHQPYRSEACALLPLLLPLAGTEGVLGVALSGAGPSVLLVLEDGMDLAVAEARVLKLLDGNEVELFRSRMGGGATL